MRKRIARRVVVGVLGTIGLLIALFAVSCSVALNQLSNLGTGTVTTRPRMKPIAMSRRVCPAVTAIHVAATRLQDEYKNNVYGETPPRITPALVHEANELGSLIERHKGGFPLPVHHQFDLVLEQLHSARVVLGQHFEDPNDLELALEEKFDAGQIAYGNASDLVGHRCNVELRAYDDAGNLCESLRAAFEKAQPSSATAPWPDCPRTSTTTSSS
jgi:hypothetical protein